MLRENRLVECRREHVYQEKKLHRQRQKSQTEISSSVDLYVTLYLGDKRIPRR